MSVCLCVHVLSCRCSLLPLMRGLFRSFCFHSTWLSACSNPQPWVSMLLVTSYDCTHAHHSDHVVCLSVSACVCVCVCVGVCGCVWVCVGVWVCGCGWTCDVDVVSECTMVPLPLLTAALVQLLVGTGGRCDSDHKAECKWTLGGQNYGPGWQGVHPVVLFASCARV